MKKTGQGASCLVVLLCAGLLLFAGCKDLFHPEEPNTEGSKNDGDGKTRVYFVNNGNDFPVTVYRDASRLNKFTDVGAKVESGAIETEPNPGAVFYVSYRILIDDVPLAYDDGPGLSVRIDAEKTTGVTIPLLSELDAGDLAKPLSGRVHIKIQNSGASSFVLQYNGSDVTPQGAGSAFVNDGETARYTVDGDLVSRYTFMKNAVTSVGFPAGLTEFDPGRLYSFKFNGTSLALLADKPLTVAQALSITPPENISAASLANGYVSLTWDRVGTETGYGIYRSDSETGTYTSIGRTEVTSYTDTAVEIWSTYYYRISAVQNNVESERSSTVVSADSLPSPQGLGVTGKTDNSVTLSWQVVPDATGYKVYKGTSSGAVNEYVAGTASVSCIVTGLGTNMDYYFTVSAVHESVESLPSVVVQGKTLHQYTVTFDADGGSPVTQTRTVGSGFSLGSSNMPSAPDRNGDTFNGWYTAANGEGSEFTAGTPVTGDITVYAWWKMPDNLSLDAALTWIGNYAVTGDTYTITLKNDETIAPKSLSYSGKTVGITLNGGTTERTVGLSTTGALFTVESGVTLTLGSNVTLRGRSDNTDSLVRVNSGGTLVMNTGSKISGNTASSDSRGGGVYVNGTFEMSGGEISGNKASGSNSSSLGGGVYVNIGTFEMSGGKISGNTASSSSSYGGGVYVNAGTFEMSDGEISGNKASGGGGGVYVAGGPFEMSGGEISGNTASSSYSSSSYGGGVYVNGTFEMSGGEISGNTASSAAQSYSSYGGGVYVYYYYGGEYNGTFTKSGGGTISDTNTATSGKVAYVSSNPYKRRNATAGPSVNMDSRVSGTAGGWE